MSANWIPVAENFWNLRGSFKFAGVLDVGTQASLVRLASGKFVFLDAYTLTEEAAREANEITGGADAVEAVINLHPFHTLHVQHIHERYPNAKLYGSARHVKKLSQLPWESTLVEDPAFAALYATDFEFSIPRGVDYISRNEDVHFSSVLALHKPTRTLHVDDTLMYLRMGAPLKWCGFGDSLRFHITLAQALERRAGAVADFRAWAEEMIERWGDAQHLCAAHVSNLLGDDNPGAPMGERMREALQKVEKILVKHEKKFG